jgi:hypothetical protein
MNAKVVWGAAFLALGLVGEAHAAEVGGHLGIALPILTLGSSTTVIGSDFLAVGITPGITVHLNDKWAVDFEFIAFNDFRNGGITTFVVDPGLIRKFDGLVVGGRIATKVGAPTNIGLVPIVVKPIRVSDSAVYFVELDVPLFLNDTGLPGDMQLDPSVTVLFQTGFGF